MSFFDIKNMFFLNNENDNLIIETLRNVDNLLLIATILILIFTICLLIFTIKQINTARMTIQQSVMPVLGIRVFSHELKITHTLPHAVPMNSSGRPIKPTLIIFIRYGIALNIECTIEKNGEIFFDEEWPSALPPLKGEMGLIIEKIDISEDLIELPNDENIKYMAHFKYHSIFDDEYESKHSLYINNHAETCKQKLIFIKRPWK